VSNVLGCICKDEVGSITEVEGNINSVKSVDILKLDNNRLPVILKFENYQWIYPYSPKHSVFHLSSPFHHTYPREFFPS
jgi:hypothetical protein